jgi:protein-S-isoprenylcysteine O-methyltransferase Ste14
MDWVLAFVATTAPLLVTGGLGDGHLPIRVVTLLWLLGFIAQVGAKLWLGRNFGLVAARRQLVLGGPYRFMRHPMYFGYLVTHLAVLGMNPSMSNAGFYLLSWVAQLPRLLAEERVLSEDLAYADYMRPESGRGAEVSRRRAPPPGGWPPRKRRRFALRSTARPPRRPRPGGSRR